MQNGREDSTTFFSLDRSLGVMHHLSYVRVGEDLRRKMGTFSHAGEEEVLDYAVYLMVVHAGNTQLCSKPRSLFPPKGAPKIIS